MLSELEVKLLRECCDQNEIISLSFRGDKKTYYYKSRFLAMNQAQNFLVIDLPSAEDSTAKILTRGDGIEAFFAFKSFRYLFSARILQLVAFPIQNKQIKALKVSLPEELKDGDKREYFRVQTGMKPPILIKFNIYEKGSDTPVLSALEEGAPQEYRGEVVDISGGGFSMRAKPGDSPLLLDKGDIINAHFILKPGIPEMEIWSEVKNKRKYKETELVIFGLQFLEDPERNRLLKYYRNQILRYVVERQREILLK